jgi:ABC-2 type transport system ATP-binding protein
LNGLTWKDIPGKIDEVINLVGLTAEMNREVGKFSHGMKQRLGIADVLIKDPKVIFFDEPTSGIDPQGIDEVLTLISNMAAKKITAIISSHQLHHIQRVCSRVGIMSKGHLITEGPIELLGRATMSEGKFRIDIQASPITDNLISNIKKLDSVVGVESAGDRLIVTCDKDLRSQISKIIVENDSMLTEVKIEEFDLEKI